jgi:hypothetical protein
VVEERNSRRQIFEHFWRESQLEFKAASTELGDGIGGRGGIMDGEICGGEARPSILGKESPEL